MNYQITRGKRVDFQVPEGINIQITHIGLNLGESTAGETFVASFFLEKVVAGSLNNDSGPVIRAKTVNARLKNKKVVSAEKFPVLTPGTAIEKIEVYSSCGYDRWSRPFSGPFHDSVTIFYTSEEANEINIW